MTAYNARYCYHLSLAFKVNLVCTFYKCWKIILSYLLTKLIIIKFECFTKQELLRPSRTLWSCGLICHVLDRQVASLNPAAINYSFEAGKLDVSRGYEVHKIGRKMESDANKTTLRGGAI